MSSAILGTTLDPEGITTATRRTIPHRPRLRPHFEADHDGPAAVTLPSWRLDLEREIDLIEEIARVYGYNRFANTLPTPGIVIAQPTAAAEAAVRTRLLALGYSEAISSTFASQADSDSSTARRTAPPLPPSPRSDGESPLRRGHAPASGLGSRHGRHARPQPQPRRPHGAPLRAGNCLHRHGRRRRLHQRGPRAASLSLGLTGAVPAAPLYSAADAPIFELKGVVESLLSLFNHPRPSRFTADAPAWLEPGRAATALPRRNRHKSSPASANSRSRARAPQTPPARLPRRDRSRRPLRPALKKITAHELSRFQAVERDFSFTFPDTTPWAPSPPPSAGSPSPSSSASRPKRSSAIPRARRSPPATTRCCCAAVFQSHERTLREEDLTAWSAKIMDTLSGLLSALRRRPPRLHQQKLSS